MSKRLKIAYRSMMNRCYTPSQSQYRHYGGRGITVCKRWRHGTAELSGYECFALDMGIPPEKTSLERKNNSKGYSPANCKWATKIEQGRNRRSTVFVTYKGERRCYREWSELTGISEDMIAYRHKKGIRGKALFAPVNKGHILTINGKTQSLTQWAREFGVNPETARNRFIKGKPLSEVFK